MAVSNFIVCKTDRDRQTDTDRQIDKHWSLFPLSKPHAIRRKLTWVRLVSFLCRMKKMSEMTVSGCCRP